MARSIDSAYLLKHIDAILAAHSGVPDEEATQPMTLTLTVCELRMLRRLIEPA